MSKIASIVACGLVASLFPFSAEAFPGSPSSQVSTSDVMQVRDFCGLGFHRNPWGTCVPNGTPYGYVAPGYVAPVVVAPPAVVVAPRVACPYGYYYYAPYNRCVPTP
jgi:hypothetical protein